MKTKLIALLLAVGSTSVFAMGPLTGNWRHSLGGFVQLKETLSASHLIVEANAAGYVSLGVLDSTFDGSFAGSVSSRLPSGCIETYYVTYTVRNNRHIQLNINGSDQACGSAASLSAVYQLTR